MNIISSFSGFSVQDKKAAQDFYQDVLGLTVEDNGMGLQLLLPSGHKVFIYEKGDHAPAVYTVLNFVVDHIETAVDELVSKGVVMERYDSMPAPQDERGILRGRKENKGPDIAWFKDPSGNILAVIQD